MAAHRPPCLSACRGTIAAATFFCLFRLFDDASFKDNPDAGADTYLPPYLPARRLAPTRAHGNGIAAAHARCFHLCAALRAAYDQ